MKTDNWLIAEFMGRMCFRTYEEMQAVPLEQLTEWEIPDDPKWGRQYQSDWSKLMPVVIKCHELTEAKEKEFPDTKDIDDPTGWRAWSYRRVGLSTDINRTYKNVVNFLEWLNQQKLTLDSTLR